MIRVWSSWSDWDEGQSQPRTAQKSTCGSPASPPLTAPCSGESTGGNLPTEWSCGAEDRPQSPGSAMDGMSVPKQTQ